MRYHSFTNTLNHVLCILFLGLSIYTSQAVAQLGGGTPKIPAFLPTTDQVAESEAMAIDGTWLISGIGKKIKFENGRAYAVDSWLHMFVLEIQPFMVVIKDVKSTSPGNYNGNDLPLLGTWTATAQPDRSLSVVVKGVLGVTPYKLTPIQLDDPDWYAAELSSDDNEDSHSSPDSDSTRTSECEMEQFDPRTGSIICLDE